MNEHKFRDELREDAKLFPDIVRLKNIPSGPMQAGLCDCIWKCSIGNFWIEYKAVEVPARADTAIFLRKITSDLQYKNLAEGFNMNGMSAMIICFTWGGKKYAKVMAPPDIDKPWFYFPDLYKCVCKPRGAAWDFEKFNALLLEVVKLRWGA